MFSIRHLLAAVGAVALVAAVVALDPPAAHAAPGEATFSEVGSHDFVVPAGVSTLTVDAVGAQGGNSNGGPPHPAGGPGGRTVATISVTPGETLQVNVGGAGSNGSEGSGTGGWNGGGDGASSGGIGGGGGGASDVRRGGTDLDDRVVVAGGGGGAGAFVVGGAGGHGGGDAPTAGGNGSSFEFARGFGGAPGGAGAGGAGGEGMPAGTDGVFGAGGDGALGLDDGGGGGGGWYGGGGGGAGDAGGGGGGGGSGYVVDSATDVVFDNGVRAGDGLVLLSWDAPEPTTTTTSTTTTSTTTTSTTSVPRPDAPGGPAASFADSSSTLQVVAGAPVTVTGSGWAPGSVVTATMHSDPVELGRAVIEPGGSFDATWTVPASTPPGTHRLELAGVGADDEPATVALSLEVSAPSPSAAQGSDPGRLSFTG